MRTEDGCDKAGRERGGALGKVGGHWQDGQTVFMDRKVSSCGRAAGASVACKDQCNAFRGSCRIVGGIGGAGRTGGRIWDQLGLFGRAHVLGLLPQ